MNIKYDINKIKDSLDMKSVIEELGLPIRRNKISCYLGTHEDKNPSMQIYPKNCYCFTCNASSDMIEATQKVLGISFNDACAYLVETFHLYDCVLEGDIKEKDSCPLKANDYKLLGLVSENKTVYVTQNYDEDWEKEIKKSNGRFFVDNLYYEDREAYNHLISTHVPEAIDRQILKYSLVKNIFGNEIDEFREEVKSHIERLFDIQKTITGEDIKVSYLNEKNNEQLLDYIEIMGGYEKTVEEILKNKDIEENDIEEEETDYEIV